LSSHVPAEGRGRGEKTLIADAIAGKKKRASCSEGERKGRKVSCPIESRKRGEKG